MATWIIIVIIIVVLIVLWIIAIFNRLIRLRNEVKNSWAQIDVQLQRRHDLIPNLVECVKEYMQYEKGTLEAVIQARSQAEQARTTVQQQGGPTGGSLKELLGAEAALTGGLGKLFALAENYPELRASENMQQLQEELATTENKVAFVRQAYNDATMFYNTSQQVFPTRIFAKSFGHRSVDLYQVEDEASREAPTVKF